MGRMKELLMTVSENMGLDGEITDELMDTPQGPMTACPHCGVFTFAGDASTCSSGRCCVVCGQQVKADGG